MQHSTVSSALRTILSRLLQLLAISWILQCAHSFLRHAGLDFPTLDSLSERRAELLAELRPQAVSLVDSFDLRDEVLDSSLGSWDGWAYHRMFHAALDSPLNREEVVRGQTGCWPQPKL